MNILKKAKNVTGAVAGGVTHGVSSVAGSVAGSVTHGVTSVAGTATKAAGGVTGAAVVAVKNTAQSGKNIASSVKHAVGNVGVRPETVVNRETMSIVGVGFLKRPNKTLLREFLCTFTTRNNTIFFRNLNSEDNTAAIDLAFLKAKVTHIPASPTNIGEGKPGLLIPTSYGEYELYVRTEPEVNDWFSFLSELLIVEETSFNPVFALRLTQFSELDDRGNGLLSGVKLRHWLQKDQNVQLSTKMFAPFSMGEENTKSFTFSEFLEVMDQVWIWESSTSLFGMVASNVSSHSHLKQHLRDKISMHEFQAWLKKHQGEILEIDEVRNLAKAATTEAGERFFGASKWVDGASEALDKFSFHQYFSSSVRNNGLDPIKAGTVSQDMTKPFCHYYCNSSHNTYLLGDQLKGMSSPQAYVNALLRGCRCVELDTWDGPGGQPIVTHGNTFCSKISFRTVVETIKEYAFKTSPYPVILSIENHCCVEQQVTMAEIFKEVLGDLLPDRNWFWSNPDALPSPEELKGKILLKGACDRPGTIDDIEDENEEEEEDLLSSSSSTSVAVVPSVEGHAPAATSTTPTPAPTATPAPTPTPPGGSALGMSSSSTPPSVSPIGVASQATTPHRTSSFTSLLGGSSGSKTNRPQKVRRAPELSSLIHLATEKLVLEKPGSSFLMSSFSERGVEHYASRRSIPLVKHLQRQLLRVYPKGARVDSSNYMPMTSWNVGAQIVALNFQTENKPLWLNDAKFTENGNSGYVLKPHFMLDHTHPLCALTMEAFPKSVLLVEIVSAHQLPGFEHSDGVIDPYVVLELYGAPKDAKKFKTKIIFNNGHSPVWREQFCFPLYVPELALLLLRVKSGTDLKKQASLLQLSETKDALQHTIRQEKTTYYSSVPVSCLRKGSRVLTLKTRKSEVVPEARLTVNLSFYYPQ